MTNDNRPREKEVRDAGRVVYVIPNDVTVLHPEHGRYDLFELGAVVWSGKWFVIALLSFSILSSLMYVFLAPKWYRAETVLIASEEQSVPEFGSQFGGLAALAGVKIGESGSTEATATLRSREFARSFIQANDLLPVLFFNEWDEHSETWDKEDPLDQPNVYEGVKYFHEKILDVSEDTSTGLVILSVEWINADVAAQWANELVRRLNEKLRAKALAEASDNLAYLRSELSNAQILSLQQSISRLVETELQSKMLAEGSAEFAFRTIDPAVAPQKPVRPRPVIVVSLAIILALFISLCALFIRYAYAERRR